MDPEQTSDFPGFPDFRANVTFVPIQFFTVVLPHCSRGTVRIVGYALRKVLGWVDEHGNPTREQLQFTYRELIEHAGVSRESIAEALYEAVAKHFLRCLQSPRPDRTGQPAQSGIYELCWDPEGRYTDSPSEFRGFYYPEAAVMPGDGDARAVPRPKAARKNIPNAFFDFLLPRERLSIIRAVGALLFYSIQWGPGGERKVPVSKSITELSRLTKLSRQHVHAAVTQARQRGYIEQMDAGCFDLDAGQESRAATYGIRWKSAVPSGRVLSSDTPAATPPPVRKGERKLPVQSEKGYGAPVGKDERSQSENVNEERSKMVNDIRVKTEHKKVTTTAAAGPSVPGNASEVAVAGSNYALLKRVGFDDATAKQLAQTHSREIIQRQIEWLPHRTPTRNRLGLLRRAIEQDWRKPGDTGMTELAGSPSQDLAKLFASHYYAAYHGFAGEPGTEAFPKDLEMAAKFVCRLRAQCDEEGQIPEWGRRFGRLIRDKHAGENNPRPNLSFALVLYGDKFLRLLQGERQARDREILGRARAAHQAEFMPAYLAYLRLVEASLNEAHPSIYDEFVQHRQRLRRLIAAGPFLASAERLARFDSEHSRLLDFADFFQTHAQRPVLNFWDWDTRLNPCLFGNSAKVANSSEAHP